MDDFNIIHNQEINIDSKSELQKKLNLHLQEVDLWGQKNLPDSKSSKTVETLIQMNEIANEKLKISLRRLSLAENEIANAKEKCKDLENINQNLSEQIYIYKEKDKATKSSVQETLEQNEILRIQNSMMQNREKELLQEVSQLKKYQEKINNEVKPYLKQLKEYSEDLEIQNQKLSEANDHKEVQLTDLKNQNSEIIKNFQLQVDFENQKSEKLIDHYEQELSKFKTDLKNLHDQNSLLQNKLSDSLDYHQKYLVLENKVIELERFIEEKRKDFEVQTQSLNDKIVTLTRTDFKNETENKDLKMTVRSLLSDNETLKENLFSTEKQLESLKFLWEQKNSEIIKLKSAMDSLEKINVELSRNLSHLSQTHRDQVTSL